MHINSRFAQWMVRCAVILIVTHFQVMTKPAAVEDILVVNTMKAAVSTILPFPDKDLCASGCCSASECCCALAREVGSRDPVRQSKDHQSQATRFTPLMINLLIDPPPKFV
ncbi:MAG: hypothetical protein JWM58_4291 [Rhizobium sp.]|nr:hypothetical protein [Rhizobium sp.]